MKKRVLPTIPKVYLCINGIWGVLSIVVMVVVLFQPWTQINLKDGFKVEDDFSKIQKTIKGVLLTKFATGYYSPYGAVYGYEFTTLDPNESRKWISYDDVYKKPVGSIVDIEISKSDSELYRIKTLSSALPKTVRIGMLVLVLLFSGVLYFVLIKGNYLYNLVINGGYTKGEVFKRKKTDEDSEGNKIFDIYIRYRNAKNVYNHIVISTKDKSAYELGSKRRLFYHLTNKNEAELLKDLPFLTRNYIVEHWIKKGILPE